MNLVKIINIETSGIGKPMLAAVVQPDVPTISPSDTTKQNLIIAKTV